MGWRARLIEALPPDDNGDLDGAVLIFFQQEATRISAGKITDIQRVAEAHEEESGRSRSQRGR